MDFFLIKDGIVENIASFPSLEMVQQLYPNHTIVEKTDANAYRDGNPINPGDSI